jgi:3-hydroxyisobutyrate dehydrogenase
MRIAVIGTGIMGAPMARNIAAAGHEVVAWNRTREKAEGIDGVDMAGSPAKAVDGADAVVTMLADGDAVQSVAPDAITGDALWLQMSTVGIAATERLADLARDRGATFVDAPVLGTKQPAEKGELVVLAGGPDDALDRAQPVFDAVGSKTVRLGEAGNGTRMKLVLNSWLVTLVEGLAETIAFAERIGVDPSRFLEIIDGAPIGAPYAQLKGKAMIDRDFTPSFPLSLALKDARLVRQAAEKAGIDLPIAQVVERQFGRAVEAGHGDEDLAAAYHATAG